MHALFIRDRFRDEDGDGNGSCQGDWVKMLDYQSITQLRRVKIEPSNFLSQGRAILAMARTNVELVLPSPLSIQA
jgi:hypothetical protein